ncbi:cell division-specific peptidoglycan biosynthesis regulator FtsW [Ruaniaceae bacterium KH17]|nr:cell division-specific peptidoglycan biosynthesis regulator FtsW [Ruaniaceae bacterium KH17]
MSTATARRTEPARATSDPGALSFYLIAGAALLLLTLGTVIVLSATTINSIKVNDGDPFAQFMGQAKFVLIGLPLAGLAAALPMRVYKKLAPLAFLGAVGLQMLIFTPLAKSVGGNTNWIKIPGTSQVVQPSEFLKIGLALGLGWYLGTRVSRMSEWRVILTALAGSLAAIGLVLYGHDMGTSLVLILIVVGAMFVAGLPIRWFVGLGILGVAPLTMFIAMSESRTQRILNFLGMGPEDDPTDLGYQSMHGLWGLGSGGVTGVGLGASHEKWSYLPEAHNDFIFAILGEELGLVGTLLVLAQFGILAAGLMRMISRHPDPFVKIATAGVTAWLIGQALMNIAVVVGILPVFGVPLPFVSAGGSSMIATLIALGIMLSFARSEPGAQAALSSRTRAVRNSLAVMGGRLRKGR